MMTVVVWNLLLVLPLFQVAIAATCSSPTTSGQLDCDDGCNEVGVCLANGVWQSTLNCLASGTVCRNGRCVAVTSQEGREYCNTYYPSLCNEVGVFPSPPDCTHYYDCVIANIQVYPSQCGGGYYFDTLRGSCTALLQNGNCPAGSSVQQCTSGTQVGIAPGNDQQHYTCQLQNGVLKMVWATCPNGYRYSVSSRQCLYVGTVGTGTVCASASKLPGPVAISGSRCSYAWCDADGNFVLRFCRSGWYYDAGEGGCVYGGSGGVTC